MHLDHACQIAVICRYIAFFFYSVVMQYQMSDSNGLLTEGTKAIKMFRTQDSPWDLRHVIKVLERDQSLQASLAVPLHSL